MDTLFKGRVLAADGEKVNAAIDRLTGAGVGTDRHHQQGRCEGRGQRRPE
jgi:hypothetical protein